MIVGKLERKTSSDGKQYLAGRTSQDMPAGSLVILERDPEREGAYRLIRLAPSKLNLAAGHEVF